jgi:D-arabinose 1-dehydrogenase-like Zn-dependent alcohol dehydrogenase
MRRMGVSPGSLVAVQGLGGLGHLALQYANKFGFRVAALSRNADKEKFARDLGAHEYIDGSKGDQGEALKKLGGAALIVVKAPDAKVISPLMKGLGLMGKMLILAGEFS